MTDAPAPPENQQEKLGLIPANENPWYLLATLHGEQSESARFWEYNEELHAKNRLAWNRFMAGQMSAGKMAWVRSHKDAGGQPRFPEEELTPYDEVGLAELQMLYARRGGGALPSGHTKFCETAFSAPLILNGFIFFDTPDFSGTNFSRDASFQSAAFPGGAWFQRTSFSGVAVFRSATFLGIVFFIRTAFLDYALFDSAIFSNHTDFTNAAFSEGALFPRATFQVGINFSGTKFSGHTSFVAAQFCQHPPDFHNASLYDGTLWHGAVWPPISQDRPLAIMHLYKYERLKQEMERLKKHEDEQFFFIKEMQCREVRDGFPGNLFSRAYGLFSNYGASVARPLWGLLALFLLGDAVFESTDARQNAPIPSHKALGLSFANLLSFLPIRKEVFGDAFLNTLSPLAHVVSTGQAIFGAVLLFLLGLTLRNRFRMK